MANGVCSGWFLGSSMACLEGGGGKGEVEIDSVENGGGI